MKKDFVSVIIPCREISYYLLFENLPALENQTCKKFEVIILPNEHTQNDLSLLKKYKWLRIIPTGKITRPALKRDMGVQKAKGEIVAFIDDDAYPEKDWLKNAVHLFKRNNNIAAVCGPGILPSSATLWEKVFDEVLKTWVGSGGYSYRFIKGKEQFVDDYPSMNFLIFKKVFESVGGFNNNYWPGEDSKLCEDVVYKKKKKILYHPDVTIFHHRRKDLSGYLKQHEGYGYHRGAFFAHGDKNSRRISYLIPTFFLWYLLFLIGAFPILRSNIYHLLSVSLPFLVYLFFLLILFFRSLLNTKNIIIAFLSPFTLFLTHVVYGIMFFRGFFVGILKKEKIY